MNPDAIAFEQVFCSAKILVLTDHNFRYAIQQGGSGAHDAWAKRADEHEFRPIPAPPRIANTDNLGMSGWIAGLDAQIMATRQDGSIRRCQYRANGQATFL